MEPIFKSLNLKKQLLNPIKIEGEELSEITIEQLILRPVIKRIVFTMKEIDRIVIFEGEELFQLHKDDSDSDLIKILLEKIEEKYN